MKWIAALIVAAVIVWFLTRDVAQKASPAPPASAAAVAPVAPAAAPAPPQAPARPAAAPTPDTRLARMQQLAARAGVVLEAAQPEPGGMALRVSWPFGNATVGVDYMELLRTEGVIAGFDERRVALAPVDRQGRRFFVATFHIRF